jgi:hypothetical protein
MSRLETTDTPGMATFQTVKTGTLPRWGVATGWWVRLIAWVAEARSHRVICLVGGIWLLNAFDLTFTIMSHEQGLLHEQNPIARQMLQNGTASIALYKIGLVLIGTYPLLKFRTTRIAELASMVVVLAYASLAMRWSACYELYAATFTGNLNVAEFDLPNMATPH